MNKSPFILLWISFWAVPVLAHANNKDDPILNQCLVQALDANQSFETTESCNQYVRGFLAGARLIDTLFIDHIKMDHQSDSTFVSRAYRTRLGQKREAREALTQAPFCLPNKTDESSLATSVLSTLSPNLESANELNNAIYQFLKDNYPCNHNETMANG